jgi:hypothetical protein
MPLRGQPGQGARSGAGMRGPMGRGDYGKCGEYSHLRTDYFPIFINKMRSLVCLLVK